MLDKKLKKVTLLLENCDAIHIEEKYINEIVISKPEIYYSLNKKTNKFEEASKTNYFALSVLKEIKEENTINEFQFPDYTPKPQEILSRRDVTSIVLKYEDDSRQQIYIPYWEEHSGLGADNLNHVTKETEYGFLIGIFNQKNDEYQKEFNLLEEMLFHHYQNIEIEKLLMEAEEKE